MADSPIVVDERIISCAGPASSLEVAWRLIEGLMGTDHCTEVRQLMCADGESKAEPRVKKYKIEKKEQEITVEIEDSELTNTELQQAFRRCQVGSCDCPTDEYDKLDSMQIEQGRDRLSLRLKNKPGHSIDPNAVAACLDHTLKKSEDNG